MKDTLILFEIRPVGYPFSSTFCSLGFPPKVLLSDVKSHIAPMGRSENFIFYIVIKIPRLNVPPFH
jgi:hypothetical protein